MELNADRRGNLVPFLQIFGCILKQIVFLVNYLYPCTCPVGSPWRLFAILLFLFASTLSQGASPSLTTLPFHLSGSHIFIDVRINDSEPMHFIFDTGAASTVINQRQAKRLKLSSDGFTPVRGRKGPSLAYYSRNSRMRMGGMLLEKVRVVHLPLDHIQRALGKNVDGIIGQDLLKHYVVQINYDTQTITLYDAQKFTPPAGYHARPFEIISGRPYIEGVLTLDDGHTLSGRFQVDNGSGSSITLYSPTVEKHQLANKIGRTRTVYTMGFTGIVDRNDAGRLKNFDLGWCQLTNVPIRLNRSAYFKKAFHDGIGHIGNALLKRFNIVFDYHNKVSYWQPNYSFAEEFAAAYSGLVLKTDRSAERVIIRHVFTDSPAARAGFTKDDEIVMVNDVRTAGRPRNEVNSLLTRSKSPVQVVVRRDDHLRTLRLQPVGL